MSSVESLPVGATPPAPQPFVHFSNQTLREIAHNYRYGFEDLVGTADHVAGAMAEVMTRRYGQWEQQNERSPYDADRDASFAALTRAIPPQGDGC